MRFLEENLVAFDVVVESPEEAIQRAGNLLVTAGHVEARYVDAMIESFQTNGPYIVIAPEIAMPHARPEDGVNEASVSLVQLKTPIKFQSKVNDPVSLVFAIGASNSDEHLLLLRKMSDILGNKEKVAALKKMTSYEQMKSYLNGGIQS